MKLQEIFILTLLSVIVNCDNVAFVKIGTYNGTYDDDIAYTKSYYLPRHFRLHTWHEAMQICRNFDMDLATFKTLAEYQAVHDFLMQNLNLITAWVYIGGITNTPRSKTDWYWATMNKQIDFTLPWGNSQPDYYKNDEWCLSLGHKSRAKMLFNDICCYSTQNFLCDKIEN